MARDEAPGAVARRHVVRGRKQQLRLGTVAVGAVACEREADGQRGRLAAREALQAGGKSALRGFEGALEILLVGSELGF